MTEILRNRDNDADHRDTVVVDFYLLTSVLHLSEALISDYRLKKSLIRFLDFAIKNKLRIGRDGFIPWLERSEFAHKKDILKILQTTPLGNPAWWLFATSPDATLELLKDLDDLIAKTTSTEPKSLKSLIRDFIQNNPKYGNAEDASKAYNLPVETILADWESQWTLLKGFSHAQNKKTGQWGLWNHLGDLSTKLLLLQSTAIPKSKRQKIAEHLAAHPGEDKDKVFAAIEKDKFPIHRPDPVLYGISLRDLMIGTSRISILTWDEMISLYETTTCTNFLAFAPLLLQPFVYSDLNIPAPSLTTLATLMGDFTGATGSFMGEITRAGKQIKWKTLGLTIGKLCEKVGSLPSVTLQTKDPEISSGLKVTSRICGEVEDLTEDQEVGEDRGWVIISEKSLDHPLDISLTEINEALKTDKIQFNKFPIVGESLVFETSEALTRLALWDRRQCKQRIVCRLHGDSGGWFNKLPSARVLAANDFSVFPSLTYTLRSEQKEYRQTLKKDLSGLASITEVGTTAKRCDRSDCRETFATNVMRCVQERESSSSECLGQRPSASGTDVSPGKSKSCCGKNSRVCTDAHSLESKSMQRAEGKANERMLSCKVSSEISSVYSKPGESTSTTRKDMANGEAKTKIPSLTPLCNEKPWCRSGESDIPTCSKRLAGTISKSACGAGVNDAGHRSDCACGARDEGSTTEVPATEYDRDGLLSPALGNEYPHAGCINEATHKSFCKNSSNRTITNPSRGEGILGRFFIAEAFKEDRRKKEIVSRMRQRRLETLKAQAAKTQANNYLKTMDVATLQDSIRQHLLKIKEIESTSSQYDIVKHKCELDEMFAELIERNLGITFPNLIGTKTQKQIQAEGVTDPHSFRYWLGDEEVTAIETWHEIIKEDYTLAHPPATKAVKRIWAAMTYIWIAHYFKRENKDWDMSDMWNCFQFKRFPLIEDDKTAIYSLIPYLYWMEVADQPDAFRVKRPDMKTLLWCPTFRLSYQQHTSFIEENLDREGNLIERAKRALSSFSQEQETDDDDTFLPEPLSDVAVSSLSLCCITEWDPSRILEEIEKFLGSRYSPELHPSVTKYHRLYVNLGVEILDKRLKNSNLSGFASYIAHPVGKEKPPMMGLSQPEVREIYTTLRVRLKEWHSSFQNMFNSVWKLVGDSWVSVIEEDNELKLEGFEKLRQSGRFFGWKLVGRS